MPVDFKHVKKQFEKSMADYDNNAVVQELMASKMMGELNIYLVVEKISFIYLTRSAIMILLKNLRNMLKKLFRRLILSMEML